MSPCTHCHAPLQDPLEHCTFCGTITAASRREEAFLELGREASHQAGRASFIVGLSGFFCFMLPVLSLVSLFFAWRARTIARTHAIPAPWTAMAGSIVSVGVLLLTAFFYVATLVLGQTEPQRRADLSTRTQTIDTLDLPSACELTELQLLETHFNGYHFGSNLNCGTRFEATDTAGRLTEASFSGSGARVTFVSCLAYDGARWRVRELREDDACP